ncbi:hypothetical protein GOP47_0015134 [Adiantum capillus-veneris]|uniref:Secreted protein n=1 Tax=Adiantum capillus-veneris TaxID=13818 RepID=A0A9D4UMS6_ADICA|nr:hypothetical protein GOP47_0015134 [Adiantum capillus-veneris]
MKPFFFFLLFPTVCPSNPAALAAPAVLVHHLLAPQQQHAAPVNHFIMKLLYASFLIDSKSSAYCSDTYVTRLSQSPHYPQTGQTLNLHCPSLRPHIRHAHMPLQMDPLPVLQ